MIGLAARMCTVGLIEANNLLSLRTIMRRDKLYPVSAVLFYKRSLSIACNPFLNALHSRILISCKSDGAINNVGLSKKYRCVKLSEIIGLL